MKPIDVAGARLGPDGEIQRETEDKDARVSVRLLAFGLSLLPLALLSVASRAGLDVRPSADEWCFLPKVRNHGMAQLVHDFYFGTNGRIANGVAVALYSESGLTSHRFLPAITVVVTAVVLWFLVSGLWRALSLRASRAARFAAVTTVTALFLLAQPNPYQTLLWPGSVVSHTLPPVLALAVVALALGAATPWRRRLAVAAALLVGLCMGTLSEETTVVALVALAGFLLVHRRVLTPAMRRFAVICSTVGAAGLIGGLAVLVTSPGLRNRRTRFGVGTASFSREELVAMARQWLRIVETVVTTWPYLAAVAVGVLLGLVTRWRSRPLPPWWLLALPAAVVVVGSLAATAVVHPVFGRWTSLSTRTWNDYLLLFVVVLAGYGVLAGMAVRRRLPRGGLPFGAAALGAAVVAAVCLAGLVAPTLQLSREVAARGERWDRQDARLRAAAAAGERTPVYVPNPIAGLREPFELPPGKDWAALCVAAYYRVSSVHPPGR